MGIFQKKLNRNFIGNDLSVDIQTGPFRWMIYCSNNNPLKIQGEYSKTVGHVFHPYLYGSLSG